MVTRSPRDLSSRPSEEAVSPFPSELATPPVTKMCFVTGSSWGATRATVPQGPGAPGDRRVWSTAAGSGRVSVPGRGQPTQAIGGPQRWDGFDDAGEGHDLAGHVGRGQRGQHP